MAPLAEGFLLPTKRVAVFRHCQLLAFENKPIIQNKTPLLILFATISHPWILDYSAKVSLIKNLCRSHEVYLLDWSQPNSREDCLTMEAIVYDVLSHAVEKLCRLSPQKKINLLGICQGGLFGLLYNCCFPQTVHRMITVSTPIEFHSQDNRLSQLSREIDADLFRKMITPFPGQHIQNWLKHLTPFKILSKQLEKTNGENQRMRQWLETAPAQSPDLIADILDCFFQKNQLRTKNYFLQNKPIALSAIQSPILNCIATYDHIIPPSSSRCLPDIITARCQNLFLEAGHINLYTNPTHCNNLSLFIDEWLH